MTNQLQSFNYAENRAVRVVTRGNEPWWVLKDVCEVLGLENPTVVARRLDDDERAKYDPKSGLGSRSNTPIIIINESGLYSVILRSDKPEAKKFKRWVTHDVLPSIRATGSYIAPEARIGANSMEVSAALAQVQAQLVKIAGDLSARVLALEERDAPALPAPAPAKVKVDNRGKHGRGKTDISRECMYVYLGYYLSGRPGAWCYAQLIEYAKRNAPELLGNIPTERTFRRRVKQYV